MVARNRSLTLPPLFWFGVALLCFGTGPLLLVAALAELGVTADPHPNPVGLGILSMLTFWPAIALLGLGAALALWRFRAR